MGDLSHVFLKFSKIVGIFSLPIVLLFVGCGTDTSSSVSQPNSVEIIDTEHTDIYPSNEVIIEYPACYANESYKLPETTENDKVLEVAYTSEQVLEFFTEYGRVHFWEAENRHFEVQALVNNGSGYYKVIVSGILNDGSKYHIDTFAVNMGTRSFYVFHNELEQYVRYNMPMSYRSETSPSGLHRIGLWNAGNRSLAHERSMIHTGILQIICLDTGNILWSLDQGTSFRAHRIFWSEDGRFVAFDNPWIMHTDVMIIDTTDFSETRLIGLTSIVDAVSMVTGYGFCASSGEDHHHTLVGWVDESTLKVEFYWWAVERTIIRGTYQLNVTTGEVNNIIVLDFDDEL